MVFVALSGNNGQTVTMTDDQGGTYFLVNKVLWNSSADSLSCFVRNTLVGSGTATVITCVSGSNTAGELVAVAMSGSSRAGYKAIRSAGWQENAASGGTPTPVLDRAALTGNPILVAVASGDTTTTPPTNWTETQDANQSTPTTALEVAYRDSGFTSTSIAFGATQSTVFASFAVELDGSADATVELALGVAAVRQKIYHDPLETNTTGGTLTTRDTDITVTLVTNATDTFTSATNDMITTEGPYTLESTGSLPAGYTAGQLIYVIVVTATTWKIATTGALAAAGTALNITSDGSGTITLVRKKATATNGRSAIVAFAALGTWANATAAPTDNKSNTLAALAGSPIAYASFAASKAGIWGLIRALGGSAHTFSKTWAQEVPGTFTSSDEPTIGGFEVKGVGQLRTGTQSEPAFAATVLSNTITVNCRSYLVIVVAGGGPVGQDHTPTWKNGFEPWFECAATADVHSNGYIQFWVGRRLVATGGTYTAAFSGISNESGQIYPIGFEDIEFHEILPPAITSTSGMPAPTLTPGNANLTPAALTSTSSMPVPVLQFNSQELAPPAITSTSSTPAPTLSPGAVNISPPALASTSSTPTPALAAVATLAPAALTSTSSTPTPTLTPGAVNVSPPAITSTSSTPAPTLAPGAVIIAPPSLTSTSSVPAPTLSPGNANLTPASLTSTSSMPTPLLSADGQLLPPAITSTGSMPAPTLAAGNANLTPASLTSTSSTPTPTLTAVATLAPAPLTSTSSTPAPVLSPGGVSLAPAALTSTSSTPTPTLLPGNANVSPPPLTSTSGTPAPTLVAGPVFIDLPPLVSSSTMPIPGLILAAMELTPATLLSSSSMPTPRLIVARLQGVSVTIEDYAGQLVTTADPSELVITDHEGTLAL